MAALVLIMSGVSLLALSSPALAAGQSASTDPSEGQQAPLLAANGQVGEDAASPKQQSGADIIVTANKRVQSIIDVDSSITALSGDDLAAAGAQDTQALTNLTPNLVVQRSIVGKIHIRGIGNENFSVGGDPSVAVHSDGIYVARASAGFFDLFDIDRVEVLRGPQGTLYGRNATGGVINVLPRTPTNDLNGYATVEYGSYDHFRAEGAAGGPIADGLTARIAGMRATRDGFIRNVNQQASDRGFGRLDSKDIYGLRGQIAYDAGIVRARVLAEYIHDDSNLPAYVYFRQPAPYLPPIPSGRREVDHGYEPLLPVLGGASRSFGSDDDLFKSNQLGLGLHLDVDLGPVTLSSVTGYRSFKFNWLNDGDGTSAFFVNYGQQDESDQWSQELRLTSQSQGRFNWLVGYYYFNEDSESLIGLPVRLSLFGLPDDSIIADGTAGTRAHALFGELYYRLNDQLKVTVGGRYSREKRSTDYLYKGLFAAPVQAPIPTAEDPNPGRRTFTDFAPKLVLTYEPDARTNIYASAAKGFKSGGFNLLANQPSFDPETIWNYELGIKRRTPGGLRFGASAFYSIFKDLQVGQIIELQSILTNAAKARIYGLEADFAYRPDDRLDIGGALGLLSAKFTRFCTADPTQPGAALEGGCDDLSNPIDLSGKTLPRAPKMSLSGYGSYRFDLGASGSLTARADARFQSRIYFTQFNRPTVTQDPYVLVNGRLTWTPASERFAVALWAQNVFNEYYFTEVLESGAFNPMLVEQGFPGPPRTVGISLSASF